MDTKIVYVLCSTESDVYFEQFLLSLTSLGIHDPDCDVEVVTDGETYRRLQAMGEILPERVSLKYVDIPEKGRDGFYNSRWIKTNLRQIVSGDFLYIDTDTVIARPLSGIDNIDADIAAVIDGNGQSRFVDRGERKKLDDAGMHGLGEGPYFNGGVFLVRDTAASHAFFSTWHSSWQKMVDAGARLYDQASLFKTNLESGQLIRELPGEWNVQTCHDAAAHYFKEAKVIHYYAALHTFDQIIIEHIKDNGGRLDAIARDLASGPLRNGIDIYRQKSFKGRLLYPYSELLYRLKNHPRLYLSVLHFVNDFANMLSRFIRF
ncbi:MAG: hypothetical protein J6O51_04950 [Bacteroidales bacterium]|nr:hypothetical protein [Bacteroidales bacterium]